MENMKDFCVIEFMLMFESKRSKAKKDEKAS